MKVAEQHLPLLQQAQTGDPAALAEILRLCQPDIRRYAKRHCRSATSTTPCRKRC